MKLHRIEVENLNSLYGPQSLDLDHDLAQAPMFLIHGRTGAGKSTLLDAVCLALFGQTPRLDRGRGDELQPHQIMSKGTASCLASVEFSLALQGGRERYRATWSCRRARGKLDGNMREPVRKLEIQRRDATGALTWETLIETDQVRPAEQRFSDALRGLTVDDFKRSILLAQGEFAAFLRATEAERSTMLERLTDTGQYAAIGRRAGEVFREKRDEVVDLRRRAEQMPVLTEAQAAETRAEIQTIDTDIAALTQDQARLDSGVRWASELGVRAARVAQTEAQVEAANTALASAQLELDRLAEHRRCQEGASVLSIVLREEGELGPMDKALAVIAAELERIAPEERSQTEVLVRANAALSEAQAAITAATPEIQRARALRQFAESARTEAETAGAEAVQKAADLARQQIDQTNAL